MDLNQLLIFSKVVEHQSFTKAAKEMGLEKSTVSTKVSQLESRLGVRLLNRTTRSVTPTDAGEGYYQYCRQIGDTADEADRFIETLSAEPQGLLRISAPLDFGLVLTREVVAPYMKDHPKVQIELDLTQRKVDLVSERFDLALRVSSRALQDSSLIAKKLRAIQIGFYAAPSFLKKHGKPTTPKQVSQLECISFGLDEPSFTVSKNGKHHTVMVAGRMLVNDVLACKEAVVSGLGISVLPKLIIDAELKAKTLVPLLEDYQMPEVNMFAVYPSRHWMPNKLKAFLQYLEKWC